MGKTFKKSDDGYEYKKRQQEKRKQKYEKKRSFLISEPKRDKNEKHP
jgi:hypothetical protein